MFGRKKRHIKFLEQENELLRYELRKAEHYADHAANGNIAKILLQNPGSIRGGQIVITQSELDAVTEKRLIIVPCIRGERLQVRISG
ncbi:MAG: hypothetical protein MR316_00890 [Lachnospiraceae bacterium]|nr:hypothetical protein [Lachnospiraceae bacterium]